MMRLWLRVAAYVFWAPVFVGIVGRIVVDAFNGEATFFLWLALGLFALSWAWGFVERRLRKAEAVPEPRKFTIYDWTEEPDGVRFHARYDDGEELEFVHARGMSGSRTEAS